ncbi:MAG: ABC transporter ATP-binding protein [Bacillota bacterium]|nr:ABC transporter ATP-binding protein [Bacillota bacterium]
MLELVDVAAGYGETEVLHGVSLTVKGGTITALIGANGAGKTTMLRCVSGVLRPWRGGITWQGRSLVGLRPDQVVRHGVAMVPEGRRVFPQMSVAENLEMGAYARRDRVAMHRDLDWVLGLFPVLKERWRQAAGTLSGGEQQMLAIARALMSAPDLLLMDEPSMGLAPLLVEGLFRIIVRIREEGKSVLLVEQNAAMALSIADFAYVLESGSVAVSGAGNDLLSDPELERAYLGI